jgi:hypothetical protein
MKTLLHTTPVRASLALTVLRSPAVTKTGDGSASGFWTSTANWVGNVVPVTGDALVFPGGVTRLATTNPIGAPGFATIWWTPPTPGLVLQSTDSLSPTNWTNAPSGTNNPATLPARCYRLFKP